MLHPLRSMENENFGASHPKNTSIFRLNNGHTIDRRVIADNKPTKLDAAIEIAERVCVIIVCGLWLCGLVYLGVHYALKTIPIVMDWMK